MYQKYMLYGTKTIPSFILFPQNSRTPTYPTIFNQIQQCAKMDLCLLFAWQPHKLKYHLSTTKLFANIYCLILIMEHQLIMFFYFLDIYFLFLVGLFQQFKQSYQTWFAFDRTSCSRPCNWLQNWQLTVYQKVLCL